MSLVGPRPERPEIIPELAAQLPGYVNRLAVKPGITGLAQILLPADRSVDDVRRKLAVDLFYIQNRTFWLDLRILLATLLRAFRLPWSTCHRLCAIPKRQALEVPNRSASPRATTRLPATPTPNA